MVIWKGGQRTKKTAEVEEKLRTALGIVNEGDEPEDESSSATSSPKEVIVVARKEEDFVKSEARSHKEK